MTRLTFFAFFLGMTLYSTSWATGSEKVFRLRGARLALQDSSVAPDCNDPHVRPTCKTLVVTLPLDSQVTRVEVFVKNSGEEQWYGPCPTGPGSESIDCEALIGSIRMLDGYKLRRSKRGVDFSWTAVNWATRDREIRLEVHYAVGPLYDDPPYFRPFPRR